MLPALTVQKMKFSVNIFLLNVNKSVETAGMFAFTKEILNKKLLFLCSDYSLQHHTGI